MKQCFLLVTLVAIVGACGSPGASKKSDPCLLPDFKDWWRTGYDEDFFNGRIAGGADALEYWMQSSDYRGNPEGKTEKRTKIERLLSDDAEQVVLVNEELRKECQNAMADVATFWKKAPQSRKPMIWIELAVRVPDYLEPETMQAICKALGMMDIAGEEANYIYWLDHPGSNGANVHGYLTPLTLTPALIKDDKAYEAGKKGLLSELNHMNHTGDMNEFNLLESHWNGTASWEVLKKYIPDQRLQRVARLITERLWINRFMTWSPAVERITGPGSRMAPSEWLGCDNERMLFATGLNQPVWINFFFPWDGWDSRALRQKWEGTQLEATVPDLPAYLQDVAWNKTYPNEFQCRVALKHWKPYPPLTNVPPNNPLRPAKYVNYQTENYALGSVTSAWVVNTCVVSASAWWNNSRNPGAPVGSPERFCVLYPHYVFNGMSFLDKGDLFYENKLDEPVKDSKGGPSGPWLREFIDFGRVGTLQDRNTLLLSYTTKPGTHHDGQNLVKTKTQRASAAMFLFRWTDGVDGLYVNKEPVRSLPCELKHGDWWLIEDGDVYAAVRPLKSTPLRGNCKTVLEKRTRHVVLYQDNVDEKNITGISDEDWVKARSGFVVEMGNKQEYGSFENFRNKILSAKVLADDADGYTRHIAYQRDDRQLEMKWHCYTEEYAERKISGKDDPWTQYAQSPEFSVSDLGQLHVADASVKTKEGKALWLLSCPKSETWVTYQTNFDQAIPVEMIFPAGKINVEKMPFGKITLCKNSLSSTTLDIDADYQSVKDGDKGSYQLTLQLDEPVNQLLVTINGAACKAKKSQKDGKTTWTVNPL